MPYSWKKRSWLTWTDSLQDDDFPQIKGQSLCIINALEVSFRANPKIGFLSTFTPREISVYHLKPIGEKIGVEKSGKADLSSVCPSLNKCKILESALWRNSPRSVVLNENQEQCHALKRDHILPGQQSRAEQSRAEQARYSMRVDMEFFSLSPGNC